MYLKMYLKTISKNLQHNMYSCDLKKFLKIINLRSRSTENIWSQYQISNSLYGVNQNRINKLRDKIF